MFERATADGFFHSADYLINSYGCAGGSSCLIIGSGPSFKNSGTWLGKQCQTRGVVPFSINWGGYVSPDTWSIYPRVWTAYDNCDKFSAQLFRDPSVVKFVNKARAIEYIYGKKYVAHECPSVFFFDPKEKSYSNFFGSGPIVDSKDSLIQAIDIAIRLGFKHISLAGCDLYVPLSPEQFAYMHDHIDALPPDPTTNQKERFSEADPDNSLWSAITEIAKNENRQPADVIQDIEKLPSRDLYYFGDVGVSFAKKVMVDHHCFTTANWLRQSRRCLDSLGVHVHLVFGANDPNSRLSKIFPWGHLKTGLTVKGSPDYTADPAGIARNLPPYRKQTKTAFPEFTGDSDAKR